MGDPATRTIRSAGERSMRGYATLRVPPPAPEPHAPEERVVLSEPIRATQVARSRGAPPRNPEQTRFPAPKPPAVELLDGRPIGKTQRIWVDPEQIAIWDEEERRKQST